MRFWPERFDGRFPDIKDPRSFVFGFGRRYVAHDILHLPPSLVLSLTFSLRGRLCPGRYLALNTVFIAIACMLSSYNISKARGPDGNEIEIPIDDSLRCVLHLCSNMQ